MDIKGLLTGVTQHPDLEIDPETPLQDLPDWDSLKLVTLVVRVEGKLGRELSEAELEGMRTCGDVSRLLDRS